MAREGIQRVNAESATAGPGPRHGDSRFRWLTTCTRSSERGQPHTGSPQDPPTLAAGVVNNVKLYQRNLTGER